MKNSMTIDQYDQSENREFVQETQIVRNTAIK